MVGVTQSQVPSTALPPREKTRAQPASEWTGGRITAVVMGTLIVLLSLILLGAGGTGLWADRTQRDEGYATTDVHRFSSSGSALATVSTELGSSGVAWLYPPGLLDEVRIRVTPTGDEGPLFVGIGPSPDVDRYLAGVNHTVITEFFGDETRAVDGGSVSSPPGSQDFWVASATGSGSQTVLWEPTDGSWTVVVMNADGRPGIAIGADLGAKVSALPWIALGFLVAGGLLLAGGALLIVSAFPRDRALTTKGNGGVMSSPTVTIPASRAVSSAEDAADRYEGIKQYSLGQIAAVWAAAALPMGVLAWIVTPAIKDGFSGEGTAPLIKALILMLTAGLFWQCVLVVGLVWHEQRTFRWSVVRNVLWLHSPRSPSTGRVGGRLWLLVVPLTLLFALGGFVPTFSTPENRDLATWIGTESGKHFMQGNWGWYAAILLLFLFNILGEELLFRGVLLPRMKGVFGRSDWLANAVLFTGYHLHEPWLMPGTLVVDTFAYVYPSRRYQSTWIGIIVHGGQALLFGALLLALVL